jgi:AraC-like DNA-binding protein
MKEIISPFEMYTSSGDRIRTYADIPDKFLKHKLPVAERFHAPNGSNDMLFQCLNGKNFQCWDSRYFNESSAVITGMANMPLLELRIAYKNHFPSDWDGFGPVELFEGQYELNYVPYANNEAELTKGIHCHTVDFHMSLDFLQAYTSRYKQVGLFVEKAMNKKHASLLDQSLFLSPLMVAHIRHILEYDGDPGNAAQYFDGAFHQLMMLVFNRLSKDGEKKTKFSKFDIDRTVAARDLMLKDISESIFIADLSAQVAINLTTLQACFKEQFGVPIHDYIRSVRLVEAHKQILETNALIKDIATATGFANHSGLTKSFKKYFHYTPEELRERYKK